MNRRTLVPNSIVTAGLLSTGILAFAAQGVEGRAVAEPAAIPLTMAQAVTIAEVTLNGHATGAKLEGEQAHPVFKFKVANARGETYRVRIAADGKVLSSEKAGGAQRGD